MYSIILPIYDPNDKFVSTGVIQQVIDNLLELSGNFELILVNNNSFDKCRRITEYLRSIVSQYPSMIKLVELNSNRGTARGFNAGLKVARLNSKYIVFMSADAEIVDKQMLLKMETVLDKEPHIGILHPVSVFEDAECYNYSSQYGGYRFSKYLLGRSNIKPELTGKEIKEFNATISMRKTSYKNYLRTFPLTFAVIRRDMIKKVGSFDNGVEKACHENNDLAYRALLIGFNVARINNIFINHRRLLFRNLTVDENKKSMPHAEAIIQSTAWWNNKWGQPYDELYTRWRVGPFIFPFLKPYFWAKRLAALVISITRCE